MTLPMRRWCPVTPEHGGDLESLEEIERRALNDLIEEEQGDAALEQLIGEIGEQPKAQPTPQPRGSAETEFTCRACHLIFARSCLADSARALCKDCAALADARGAHRRELPHVTRVHHPCPACGALLMAPEREEVSCGFVCPACRVHLMMRGGHLHLAWNHREAQIGAVEALRSSSSSPKSGCASS